MLIWKHFTFSCKILAHFEFDGRDTSQKSLRTEATKGWKGNWYKSETNEGALTTN